MFTYCLSSFVILWVYFDDVVVYVYGILVFAPLDDAFWKLGTLIFYCTGFACIGPVGLKTETCFTSFSFFIMPCTQRR